MTFKSWKSSKVIVRDKKVLLQSVECINFGQERRVRSAWFKKKDITGREWPLKSYLAFTFLFFLVECMNLGNSAISLEFIIIFNFYYVCWVERSAVYGFQVTWQICMLREVHCKRCGFLISAAAWEILIWTVLSAHPIRWIFNEILLKLGRALNMMEKYNFGFQIY